MATCSNCRAESARVRSRWDAKGIQLPDECPSCSPGSFEKFSNPSDKKIWMGYEAHPNEYEKRYVTKTREHDSAGRLTNIKEEYHQNDPGGAEAIYIRKPEYRAEQEERLRSETEEERELREQAEAKKRATRRTGAMTPAELKQAIAKAMLVAESMEANA